MLGSTLMNPSTTVRLGGPRRESTAGARWRVRVRARRHERGAALLIVVLVIMSLTGVALFAARSASTDVDMAGRFRQAEQTRYVADLGMQTAIAQVANDPQAYLGAMTQAGLIAGANAGCNNQVTGAYDPATGKFTGSPIDTGGCYAFNQKATDAAVSGQTGGAIASVIDNTTLASGLKTDFKVELTDKDSWDFPVSGYASNSDVNMKFYTVTLSATGLVLPTANGVASNYKVSRQDLRAQLTVGPLPDGI